MKILNALNALILILMATSVWAQETPYVEYAWTEGDGVVAIDPVNLPYFGQTIGRYEVDWTPGMLHTTGVSQQILDIPNHLGLWIWNDGVHGKWFDDAGNIRLFRTRWGLPTVGTEIKIVVTWNSGGYAVVVDDVLRIHDWQTTPSDIIPDPDIVSGVFGAAADGTKPASGTFKLRIYDLAQPYNPCTVDPVGTINEGVPDDNTGTWSQGIDPICAPSGAVDLTWVAPTENDDGTPYIDADGYKIYHGRTQGGPYPVGIDIADPATTSTVITGLADGLHYFVATAYNVVGVESVYSNEAVKVVDAIPTTVPNPPTSLTVMDLTAYSVIKIENAFMLLVIGSVPAGTPCDPGQVVNGHNAVDRAVVTMTNENDEVPLAVVANCS